MAEIITPAVFPDKRVDHVYLHQEVDNDLSAFAWGVLDLHDVRQFLMATMGERRREPMRFSFL